MKCLISLGLENMKKTRISNVVSLKSPCFDVKSHFFSTVTGWLGIFCHRIIQIDPTHDAMLAVWFHVDHDAMLMPCWL